MATMKALTLYALAALTILTGCANAPFSTQGTGSVKQAIASWAPRERKTLVWAIDDFEFKNNAEIDIMLANVESLPEASQLLLTKAIEQQKDPKKVAICMYRNVMAVMYYQQHYYPCSQSDLSALLSAPLASQDKQN